MCLLRCPCVTCQVCVSACVCVSRVVFMCVWCKGGKGGRGCVTRWLHLHTHMRTHNGTKHLHAQVSFTCERPSMAERRNLLNFDEETPDKSCYVTWDDFVKEQECLILATLLQYRPKVVNRFTFFALSLFTKSWFDGFHIWCDKWSSKTGV